MNTIEQNSNLYVCHECDALQDVSAIKPGKTAVCVCCDSTLFKNPVNAIDKPLALVIASMILFLIANIYPIMTLNIAGIERSATLTDSALIFIELGSPELAAVVWVPSVFIPGFILFSLLYVLLSIRLNLRLCYTKSLLVWVSRLLPWGMMDVFLLGVLVALVKLVALADILLGTGFYALVMLIFSYAATCSTLEPHILWQHLATEDNHVQ